VTGTAQGAGTVERAGLVVVLVEPAGPLNVGSVARLCANFAVSELRLVAPRCDHLGEEARRMAVHAAAVLDRAGLYPSLAAALVDCRRVVACSGRRDGEPLPLQDPDTALSWLLQGCEPSQPGSTRAPLGLVFGREDRGLSNDELLQAGRLLCIETASSYASLNLAQAVAIALQRVHSLAQAGADRPTALAGITGMPTASDPCERGAVEDLFADLEALLLEVGFLYPHTAAARLAKIRCLLQRAQVTQAEVALLRGMVRQLRWASRRGQAGTAGTP
jgi:tRNA/rRNA methyltransferase